MAEVGRLREEGRRKKLIMMNEEIRMNVYYILGF